MIELDAGNVLLKPSHRKQLMAWLRRPLKMGEALGNFILKLSMVRIGGRYEIRANVHDSAGDFQCHSRQRDWRTAIRDMIRQLAMRLHAQRVQQGAM